MQVELLDRQTWNTRLGLANAIFEYLEIWHNRRRRHSQLGWLTPIEFDPNRIVTVACNPNNLDYAGPGAHHSDPWEGWSHVGHANTSAAV